MKGREAFLSTSIVNFADGWQWFKVSRKIPADAILGMMVKGHVIHISSKIGGQFVMLIEFIFDGAHKNIGEQRTKRRSHCNAVCLLMEISVELKELVLSGCVEYIN